MDGCCQEKRRSPPTARIRRFADRPLWGRPFGSFCQEQTFAVVDLSDRAWSTAALRSARVGWQVSPEHAIPCIKAGGRLTGDRPLFSAGSS